MMTGAATMIETAKAADDSSAPFDAAVLYGEKEPLTIEPVRLADLRDDEVLVRIVACGICHSDIAIRDGVYPCTRPVVLGHEGSGVVERIGTSVTKVAPGDHVVLSFTSCGECPSCRDGEPAYCHLFGPLNTSGLRADGSSALCNDHGAVGGHFFGQSSFATFSVANVRNVVKVRDDAPLELLGPLGCGIQTGAGAVLISLAAKPGQKLVVIGAGGVGLAGVMAGKIAGCAQIILSEPNAERRALGLELGATDVIDPMATPDLTAKLMDLTGGGADIIFDTSGLPAVVEAGMQALAPRGRLGIVAFKELASAASINLVATISLGRTLRGICEGDAVPDEFIPKLIDYFMAGKFPVDKLVRYYDFTDINRALEDQRSGAVVKPILRMPA
jgi:aryl-alcohol dehydrogenase